MVPTNKQGLGIRCLSLAYTLMFRFCLVTDLCACHTDFTDIADLCARHTDTSACKQSLEINLVCRVLNENVSFKVKAIK